MIKNFSVIILVALALLISSSFYIVDQTQQVIKLRLGKPVAVVKEPGLNFKIPFLEQVSYFEKRIVETDSAPGEVITKEKKTLLIDNFAKWKITDPLKFLQTVRTHEGAIQRLDDLIFSELRVAIGTHKLLEVVSDKRRSLMDIATKNVNEKAGEYGIEVIDVRIKRADLPADNANAVFGRMKAERSRIAREYRSEGEEESKKITAATDKQKSILLSEAYEKEQKIRAKGDAESIRIYAEAFSKDKEFYKFMRTLEAYKKTINKKTTLVLSPDSDFFKLLSGIEKTPSK